MMHPTEMPGTKESRTTLVVQICTFPMMDPWEWYQDAPCMDYLPTLGENCPHSAGNVGKYSLHAASGVFTLQIYHKNQPFMFR